MSTDAAMDDVKRPADEKHNSFETAENRVETTENINARLANPLAGIPHDQLIRDAENFAKQYGLGDLTDEFRKGALLAQEPLAYDSIPLLSDEERAIMHREQTHRWDQPMTLYWLVVMCSVAAAVQGVGFTGFSAIIELTVCAQMDETVINGAQIFYQVQFGINSATGEPNASRNQWLVGLVNSAPYVRDLAKSCLIHLT